MFSALLAARGRLTPYLPPFARRITRIAWYYLVLPPARASAALRERFGRDYSSAPPPHILAQYGITSPAVRVHRGEQKYAMIQQHLSDVGLSLPPNPRILDFGCGAVGTLSAFARHLPDAISFGCDLKADVVAWAKKYRPHLIVVRNEPSPPLPPEFTDFDLVYAISVWTHMPESACSDWLKHMHERIKPGGVLFFTIVEPSSEVPRKHGFDRQQLSIRVRESGGCLYDAGTDLTFIQRGWLENQIRGRFSLRYLGPAKGYSQWSVVLEKQ